LNFISAPSTYETATSPGPTTGRPIGPMPCRSVTPKPVRRDGCRLRMTEGPLFPELEAYLAELPQLGVPIVLTADAALPGPPRTSMPNASCGRHAVVLVSALTSRLMHAGTVG